MPVGNLEKFTEIAIIAIRYRQSMGVEYSRVPALVKAVADAGLAAPDMNAACVAMGDVLTDAERDYWVFRHGVAVPNRLYGAVVNQEGDAV